MWCSKLKLIILVIILFLFVIIGQVFTYQFELMEDRLDATYHEGSGDVVVLLHGIARTKESMEHIANAINVMDFEVINIQYPSTHYDIATLAQKVDGLLDEKLNPDKKLHIIGYSLGGLVARQLIADHGYTVDRIVMMGTPNHGSEVADYFKDWWLFQKIWGPAGQELTTYNKSIPLLPPEVELTVIAGATTNTTAFGSLLPTPNDGTVSVASTKLEPMRNHISVDATHYRLLVKNDVWAHVLHALTR